MCILFGDPTLQGVKQRAFHYGQVVGFLTEHGDKETVYALLSDGSMRSRKTYRGDPNFNDANWETVESIPTNAQYIGVYPFKE